MPTALLISGLPCSGKTTYARAIAEAGAILFSLDYWLITLYGRYSLDGVGYAEHVRRVLGCREIISGLACDLLCRGLDVVLDDGFFLREHRMRQIAAFRSVAGVRVLTQVVQVAPEVLQARLEYRNRNLPEHNFLVAPDALQKFIGLYEEPSDDEGAQIVRVDGEGMRQTARVS